MSLDFTDDQSTLVQVMVWCRQATSHYLNQCWPRSLSLYGGTMSQWVNSKHTFVTWMMQCVKSLRVWYIYEALKSSFIHIVPCRLFYAKLLYELMWDYCQFGHWEKTVSFEWQYHNIQSNLKITAENATHLPLPWPQKDKIYRRVMWVDGKVTQKKKLIHTFLE